MKPLLTDTKGIRIVLTLLTLLRSISLKPVLDTKTITDPWNGIGSITDRELKLALSSLRILPGVKD
jgi:hypothetical protein